MSNPETLIIATRKSPLALWQAEHVAERLGAIHPHLTVSLLGMSTQGDRILDAPLAKIGGKGLFVKELENGLLDGSADIAVHSMKDVPVALPDGLHLAAILAREDPTDALVSNQYTSFKELPATAKIGTSSLRRQCQLKTHLPDCEILSLRGNVNTRLAKLDAGQYDAIVLASAGLKRLKMDNRITETLTPEVSLPAIGQGAIGIECRIDDPKTNQLLKALHDPDTSICVEAERAMNERLQGGCQVPIAGFAQLQADGHLLLRALVGSPDGSEMIYEQQTAPTQQAQALGYRVADKLLSRGADRILKQLLD